MEREHRSFADDPVVRNLLDDIGKTGSAPGAVAVSGLVAAIAAAVGVSGTAGADAAERALRYMIEQALSAADQDTTHYWADASGDAAVLHGPRSVSEAAIAVASTAGTSTGNNADLGVAAILAIGASAAAASVADWYTRKVPADHLRRTGRLLLAAGVPPAEPLLEVVGAAGCWLVDESSRQWFDAASGLWNVPLGHGHPAPIAAFLRQCSQVAAVNPFMATAPVAASTAEQLLDILGEPDACAFFGSSGSEMVEAAMRFGLAALPPGSAVWALPGAFHGSTAGAAGLAGFESVWGPLPTSARWPMSAIPDEWTAPGLAFVEPARAVDGYKPLSAAVVEGVRRFQQRGGLVVVDEVATGLGRAAWPVLSPHIGLRADITLLGKGLANGIVPVSALVVRSHVVNAASSKGPLDFGHTHSSHPASLAAAAECLRTLGTIDLPSREADLTDVLSRSGIRAGGTGLLRTIRGVKPRSRTEVTTTLKDAGLVCHTPTTTRSVDRLTIAPPLTVTESDLQELASKLRHVCEVLGW